MSKSRSKRWDEAIVILNQAAAMIEELQDEVDNQLANTPDNLQTGDRYDRLSESLDTLQEQVGALDDIQQTNPFDN